MTTTDRKAVITTAQVQEALNGYTKVQSELSGLPVETLEFDKGARGKGFAVYNKSGNVVDSFETKEVAYVKFTIWAKVAGEVIQIQADRKLREAEEAKKEETTPKTVRKPAEKAAA